MPFLTLTSCKWLIAAALVVVLFATHIKAYQAGSAYTQAQWDAAIAQQMAATLKLVQDAQDRERSLQASAEKLRKAKNDEIHDLATKLADAVDSLRSRPNRPSESSVPATPRAGDAGCYPSQLYLEDAKVALGIAADAEELLAYAKYCQAQYNKARKQVK